MKFDIEPYCDEYNMFMRDLRSIPIPGSTGGMTSFPGLFIYTVARQLGARKILEVGTRNGISAATFARALTENGGGVLVSCDVRDVEAGDAVPGKGAKAFPLVPSKMIAKVGDGDNTLHFIHNSSMIVLPEIPEGSLDIVLLDGSHKEDEVYREIPFAMDALKSGGVMLLDDVYPDGAPLKCHHSVIEGPWLALERAVEDNIISGYSRPSADHSVAYVVK